MKKSLGIPAILCALLVSLVAVGPAAAKGGSDHLDLSFGKNGRAIVRPGLGRSEDWAQSRVFAARAPDGQTVVAASKTGGRGARIVRFDRDGKLDRSFGRNGVVTIETVLGARFAPAGIAVGRDGRIVIAGKAVVVALDQGGALDPRFGGGSGAVRPALPIPRIPLAPGETPPAGPVGYAISDIVVDGAGRIVITGSANRASSICPINSGYIARLTAEGGLDPSFGSGGVVLYDPNLAAASGAVALAPEGALATWHQTQVCKVGKPESRIELLSGSGQPSWSFDTELAVGPVEFGAESDPGAPAGVAVDRVGDTVFVTSDGTVGRLLRDGTLDPGFGSGGVFDLRVTGQPEFSGIAAAPDGSVLVTGSREAATRVTVTRTAFLASLTAAGKPRRGFGDRGVITLRSAPGGGTTGHEAIALGNSAALVAGTGGNVIRHTPPGVGLFRFVLDPRRR